VRIRNAYGTRATDEPLDELKVVMRRSPHEGTHCIVPSPNTDWRRDFRYRKGW